MKKIILCLTYMMITCIAVAQPSNDEPCGAGTIPVLLTDTCLPTNTYSWTGATSSTLTPLPACNWNPTIKDVWYKFTAPVNGTYNIVTDVSGGPVTDIILGVYSASACNGTFTYVACNDDGGPGNMPFLSLPGLAAGTVYYLRIAAFGAAFSDAGAKICIYFSEPEATAKVGIGTVNPGAALDINGSIRIRGGSPEADKVLTSDANGLASWKDVPNKPGTVEIMNVPFSAFKSEIPGIDVRITTINGAWVSFDNGTAGNIRMSAPVNLPNGVKITSMTMYYYDFSAAANITVSLDYGGYNPPSANYGGVSGTTLTSSGTGVGVASQSLTSGALNHIVDNQLNGYFLRVSSVSSINWPGDLLKLGMITITYELQ